MAAPINEETSCELPLGIDAAGAARLFVERTVPAWGAGFEETATAKLLASELVTNAVLYGHGARTLGLRHERGRLRILVTDSAPGVPTSQEPSAESETGRGMQLVEACAHEWGFEPHDDGKVVWCEVLLTGQ